MAWSVTLTDLQQIAEFDCPFTVHSDGTLTDAKGVYAPEVYHSETDDIEITSDIWEALTGYTGQYGYNGACMHASEYLGGQLAADILSTPGTYVLVVVEVMTEYPVVDDEPAGWAVLRLRDSL